MIAFQLTKVRVGAPTEDQGGKDVDRRNGGHEETGSRPDAG